MRSTMLPQGSANTATSSYASHTMARPNAQLRLCRSSRLSTPKARSGGPNHRQPAPVRAVQAGVAVNSQPAEAVDVAVAVPKFEPTTPSGFAPNMRSFIEEHRIRGYEVGPDQRATLVTMANLLQEGAGNHAVGMWGKSETGFANIPGMDSIIFVMTRLQIRMWSYPRWGDLVRLETYFNEEGRLAARREFELTNIATGELLGVATSTWVTINIDTRRFSKLPDHVRNYFLRLSPTTARHCMPIEETKIKLPDLQPDKSTTGPKQLARRSDIDMNGHINNVTFLAWLMESIPGDVWDSHQLFEVVIDYKSECHAGDNIASLIQPLPDTSSGSSTIKHYLHSLVRTTKANSTSEMVRARTSWVPK